MAGPWIFSTLVGLSVLVQLCTAQSIVNSERPRLVTDSYNNPTNHLLRRIMGNVRRISDMLAFQMLDQEEQHATLEEKRASMNPKRKCILQSLVLGKPVDQCTDIIDSNNALKNTRRSLGPRRRRLNSDGALNSNSNVNINSNSNNEDDNSLKSEVTSIKKKPRRKEKIILNRKIKRTKPVTVSQADNSNANENFNNNFNDELYETGVLNDENDGLSVLSDNDDGPGALNDEIDGAGTLNDENNGPSALNDETDSFGRLSDEADGAGALDDEGYDQNLFNDEGEGPGTLNDDYNSPVGGEKLADEFEI